MTDGSPTKKAKTGEEQEGTVAGAAAAAETSPQEEGNTAAVATSTSPYSIYWSQVKIFIDEYQGPAPIIGKIITHGLPDDDEDSVYSDEGEEVDTSKYTTEQMNNMRLVMVTQKRADKLEEMGRFVLGDQYDEPMMFFNTSYSMTIYAGFFQFKASDYGRKAKKWPDKFDILFAYTFNLMQYDVWIHDNEGGMGEMTKGLAGMWKRLLKKTDEELGIDAEYTRPGIIAFLENFKKSVESHNEEFDDSYAMTFKFQ